MGKKWIDKKTAVKFAVVNRSHEDPLYYADDKAAVLVPIDEKGKKRHHIKKNRVENLKNLENDIKESGEEVRDNEGEAAEYGIPFDDTKYDYMQHLRPIEPSSNSVFIPKKSKDDHKSKEVKFKLKQELMDNEQSAGTELSNYKQQQSIPDELSGFNPDLNSDVREAMVALEDDAYLDRTQDQDDTDVFGILLTGEKQKDLTLQQYDALDEKEKAKHAQEQWDLDQYENNDVDNPEDFDWEKDFKKFKQAEKYGKVKNDWDSDDDFDDVDDSNEEDENRDTVGNLPDFKSSKHKSKSKKARRKKGAMTDTSSYSMSSSAMCRTEQMTVIDDRFDVMKKKYEKDDENDDEPKRAFDYNDERSDFKGLIDDFLDSYEEKSGHVVKKNKEAARYRDAADEASNTKLARRRRKQRTMKKSGNIDDLTQKVSRMAL